VTQYYVQGDRVEFLQVDTESGELLSIVNGARRHYQSTDVQLAASRISEDLTREPVNTNTRSRGGASAKSTRKSSNKESTEGAKPKRRSTKKPVAEV
jgi:hypothetical protein